MLSARDEIAHIASLDALDLADDFDRIASRQWDGKANAS